MYKRLEYLERCKRSLYNAQGYINTEFYFLDGSNGLRNTIIDFFDKLTDEDIIAKMDSDCSVPGNWLNDIINLFYNTDLDIVSPNVYPSNAAYKYGSEGELYRPSETVGGLWVMKKELIDDIHFERHNVYGIKGAYNILKQIIAIKQPKVGWAHKVIVQDLGHWSGEHPEHIKSSEHEEYYHEVGRSIAW